MNDAQIGSIFRVVRIRRGMTQATVAAAAGVSPGMVSLLERGHLERVSVVVARSVARALGISLSMEARWRGAETARLLDERHALLARAVAKVLSASGWQIHLEYTFNVFGERGSIDILAWQPQLEAVVALEIKTRLVDLQDLLSTTDRKARLLPVLCRNEGWRPKSSGSVIVLPEESWARHAVRQFQPIFATAFPARTVVVRRWLEKPAEQLRGLWFLSIGGHASANRKVGAPMRVRSRSRRPNPVKSDRQAADLGPNEPVAARVSG